ncbi:unnamed protein product [Brassica rapa]|uniref:Uncharacterized protein n=2 Tax=Brassica TaxID=3705 RepID=A0A8D9CZH4_BRACM|nr:unnamed protein product [Brassica napus]CAG7864342.1 unnamed protein product [Brassica rapa]
MAMKPHSKSSISSAKSHVEVEKKSVWLLTQTSSCSIYSKTSMLIFTILYFTRNVHLIKGIYMRP